MDRFQSRLLNVVIECELLSASLDKSSINNGQTTRFAMGQAFRCWPVVGARKMFGVVALVSFEGHLRRGL